MDDKRGESQNPPASYIFEFGTWRHVPANTARSTAQTGRPPKKKGG